MKKLLVFLVVLSILVCALPIIEPLTAATINLLPVKDTTFESGSSTNWQTLSGGEVQVVDNPHGTGKVLAYMNCPDKTWATPFINIKPAVQSAMKSAGTIYISVDVYAAGGDMDSVILIRTVTPEQFSLCKEVNLNYCTIGTAISPKGQWTRLQTSVQITNEDLKVKGGYWNLCFDYLYKCALNSVVYIDNLYVGTEPFKEQTQATIPPKTAITRSDTTKIGTIRWDAFTKSTANGTSPSSQVARVLSPAKYHNQAPFFANINADGTVSFPEYTLATWEKEAIYASDAGLDYFAYLWYESNNAMSQPRKLHLKSSKKNLILMAGILEGIRSDTTMNELFEAMKDSCYLKLSGRPVLFLYSVNNWTANQVKQIRQAAANAGIKKALYIIGMQTNPDDMAKNYAKDIDAFSWYGTPAGKTAEPYAELVERCEDYIMKRLGAKALANNYQIVPSFTAGRDTRARIQTGVSWTEGDPNATNDKEKPYKNYYSLPPTMDELGTHIKNVYNYVNDNPSITQPNLVLSYGWNEHDEGGWLCPTLLCHSNGDPVLDASGKPKINTERLDTFKSVVSALRAAPIKNTKAPSPNAQTNAPGQNIADEKNTPSPESTAGATSVVQEEINVTATPESTTATLGTDQPEEKPKGKFNVWYVLVPVAAAAAAVSRILIIIRKKKRAAEKEKIKNIF